MDPSDEFMNPSEVISELLAASGETVAVGLFEHSVEARQIVDAAATLFVGDPVLWHAFKALIDDSVSGCLVPHHQNTN